MRPLAPAGIRNPRKRNPGTKKVHLIFSLGPHLQKQTVTRLRRLTRKLKKGDTYFKEGAMSDIDSLVFEGKREEAIQAMMNIGRKRSKGKKSEANLRAEAEFILAEVQRRPELLNAEIRKGMEGFHQEQDRLIEDLKRKGVKIRGERLKGNLAENVSQHQDRMDAHQENFGKAIDAGNYGFALNAFINLMNAHVEQLKIRDPALIEKLRSEIQESLRERKGKTERIFARLGESHTLPFHALSREFKGNPRVKIERRFDRKPAEFFPDDALARKMIFRPKNVTKEDYAKAMMGALVQSALLERGVKNEKYLSRTANTAAQIASIQDVQEIFKVIRPNKPESFQEAVLGYLRLKRIIQ